MTLALKLNSITVIDMSNEQKLESRASRVAVQPSRPSRPLLH